MTNFLCESLILSPSALFRSLFLLAPLCLLLTCLDCNTFFQPLCQSVCSQSDSCRPIRLIPLALMLPIEENLGRLPLHPLSMGPAQRTGIVHRLGPGLGLTPAPNTLHPGVPASSPLPMPKPKHTHCNVTPGCP